MDEISIIGIDLAKRSFQVHGARADGSVELQIPPQRHRCHYVRAKVSVHEYEDGGVPKRTFHVLRKPAIPICSRQAVPAK